MQQKSLGLIEARGLLTAVECADAAVKSANVELLGYEACRGGGWTTIKVVGDVGAVKAAVAAARVAGEKVNGVVSAHVIARPSAGLSVMIANADTVGYQMPTPEVVAPQEDSAPEVAPAAPAEAPVAPVEEVEEAPEAPEEPESPVEEAPAEQTVEAIVEEIVPVVEEAPVAEPTIEPEIIEEAEPVAEIVVEAEPVAVAEAPDAVTSEVAEEEPSDDQTDAAPADDATEPVASPAKPASQNRRKRSQRRKNPPAGTTQPKDPQ